MNRYRPYLPKFLSKKQVELSELLASRRTRNFGRNEFRAGKKTLMGKEHGSDQNEDEEVIEDHIFLSGLGGKDKKPGAKNAKCVCPIKYGTSDTNRSFVFCKFLCLLQVL